MKTLNPPLSVVVVFITLATSAISQTTNTWTNTAGGNWLSPANWSSGSAPATNTTLIFTNGNYTITSTGNMSAGGWSGSAATINFDLGASNTLTAGGAWIVRNGNFSFLSGNYSMQSLSFGQGQPGASLVTGSGTRMTSTSLNNWVSATSSGSTLTNYNLTISNGATVTGTSTGSIRWISTQASNSILSNSTIRIIGDGTTVTSGAAGSTLRLMDLGNTAGTAGSVVGNNLFIDDGAELLAHNANFATRGSGGTLLSNNTITIGGNGTGALFEVLGTLTMGQNAAGTTNINNGIILNTGGAMTVGSTLNMVDSSETYIRVDGGSLTATNATLNNNNVRMTAGAMVIANFTNSSTSGGFGNAADANSRFAGGTLQVGKMLHNATSYTFSVGDGEGSAATAVYEMTGNSTHQFANNLLVASDGALRGNGSISGTAATNSPTTLTLDGQLAPGNSVGAITLYGDLVSNATAEFVFELSSASSFDQLTVTGNLGFGGTLRLSLIDDYNPLNGASFNLFDFGTGSGTFSALDLPTLGGGLSWDTSDLYTGGSIGVVPEPSTWALMAFSLAALLIFRLRRRRA